MFRFLLSLRRAFSLAPILHSIPKRTKLPPRPRWLIIEEELEEKFLKGGRGPGGQKINKTNSKVQLTHRPTGIVVTCQYSRSQESNRKKAREILALKLDDLQNPETSRNAVVGERKTKLKQSKAKKANRKYRVLDEARAEVKAKQADAEAEGVDPEVEFNQMVEQMSAKTKKEDD